MIKCSCMKLLVLLRTPPLRDNKSGLTHFYNSYNKISYNAIISTTKKLFKTRHRASTCLHCRDPATTDTWHRQTLTQHAMTLQIRETKPIMNTARGDTQTRIREVRDTKHYWIQHLATPDIWIRGIRDAKSLLNTARGDRHWYGRSPARPLSTIAPTCPPPMLWLVSSCLRRLASRRLLSKPHCK